MSRVVFASVLVSWVAGARAGDSLKMQDIENLYQAKSYVELVQTAKKVPPSERTKRWNEVLIESQLALRASMGPEWLAAVSQYDAAVYQNDARLSAAVLTVLKEAVETCNGAYEVDRCLLQFLPLSSYVSEPKNRKEWLEKLVSKSTAVSLKLLATTPPYIGNVCELATINSLIVAALNKTPGSPEAGFGRAQLEGCWSQVSKPAVDALSGSSEDYARNACPELLERKAVAGLLKKRCELMAK
jgi:hypothetical protein